MQKSNDNAVFISATEKDNLEELRNRLQLMITEAYRVRYPYKSEFY
jgi:GTP-binding protein HflX